MSERVSLHDLPDDDSDEEMPPGSTAKRVVQVTSRRYGDGYGMLAVNQDGRVTAVGLQLDGDLEPDPDEDLELQAVPGTRANIGLQPLLELVRWQIDSNQPSSVVAVVEAMAAVHGESWANPLAMRAMFLCSETITEWFEYCLVGGAQTTRDMLELLGPKPPPGKDPAEWRLHYEHLQRFAVLAEHEYDEDRLLEQQNLMTGIMTYLLIDDFSR